MSFTTLPIVESFGNNDITTVSSPVAPSDQVVSVASVAGYPTDGQFRLLIGTELLLVTGFDPVANQFQVVRGAEGTTAASHSPGDQVTCILTRGSLLTMKANTGPVVVYQDSTPNPTGNVFASFDDAYAAARALGVPSTIVIDPAFNQCQIGDADGFTATISSLVGSTATITGLTGMTQADVGKTLNIQFANTVGNNGSFPITAVLSSSSVQYTNPSANPNDTRNGHIVWYLFDGLTASVSSVQYLTLITGLTGLTPAIIGQNLSFFGAGQPANNGSFPVFAYVSPSAVWINNPSAVAPDNLFWGTQAGSTASVSAFDGISTATITGLSGMTAADVGLEIQFSGAASGGNNGIFLITAFISATSVQINNGGAVAPDANNGALSWILAASNNIAFVTAALIPLGVVTGLTGVSPSKVGNSLMVQNGGSVAPITINGAAASITTFVNNTTLTITGLTGVTSRLLGAQISLTNTAPGNNGSFFITSTTGSSQVTYSNQNGSAPDPNNGSINWSISVNQNNSTASAIVGYISATSVLWNNPTVAAPDPNNGSLWWHVGTDYDLSQITLAGTGINSPVALTVQDGATFNRGVKALNGVMLTTEYNYQLYLGTLGLTGATFPQILCDQQGGFNDNGGGLVFDLSLGNPGSLTLTLDHGASVNGFVNTGNNVNSGLAVTLYADGSVDDTLIQGAQGSVTITVAVPGNAGGNPPVVFSNFYGKIGGAITISYTSSLSAVAPFTGNASPLPLPNSNGRSAGNNIVVGTMYYDQNTNQPYWWDGTQWNSFIGGYFTTNLIQCHANTQTAHLAAGDHVTFDSYDSFFGPGVNILLDTSSPYSNVAGQPSIGRITLSQGTNPAFGHLYKLTANVSQVSGSGNIYFQWWYSNTSFPAGTPVGNGTRLDDGTTPGDFASHGDCVAYIWTRTGSGGTALAELRIMFNSGMTSIGENAAAPLYATFTAEQIF